MLFVQKFDMILYGDSIFESLLGSVVGHPVSRAADLPEVWSRFHQPDTDKIFALAGKSDAVSTHQCCWNLWYCW